MATVSLIMLADGIVVVDFVAAEVEMLFGEEMMNSAVSMMFSFFFWEGRREIYVFLNLPLFNILFCNLQKKSNVLVI